MYRLPPDYHDGLKINFSTTSTDRCLCFFLLIDKKKSFDVVFIDSYHTYEASRRDLELALLVLDKKAH